MAPKTNQVPLQGKELIYFTDFRTENGSSQGQNLALTVLYVPSSLDRIEREANGDRRLTGAQVLSTAVERLWHM